MRQPVSFNECPVFVIAEIGGNHEGDPSLAHELLESAASSGAHAVKFQIYRAASIVSERESPERFKHFTRFELEDDVFVSLAQRATELGVHFMASLWDDRAVTTFDPYLAVHKVGSGDLTNWPLLRRLALTEKPVILSTALATISEVRSTVQYLDSVRTGFSRTHLSLLHCVAMYGEPKDEYAELGAIQALCREFPEVRIGYSDHTKGMDACELAIGLGATIIEKHFTDDKTKAFRDHEISATAEELTTFMTRLPKLIALRGSGVKAPVEPIESPTRIAEFRRSVCATRSVAPGELLTADMLTTLRPLVGIDARDYDAVIGRRVIRPVAATQAIRWDDLE